MGLRTDRLRALREQKGLSRRQLALASGFSAAQVRKYEEGIMDPSATYLSLMAEQLGVSTDYLLGRTDNPRVLLDEESLNRDENDMVSVFRREGWRGVIRLGAERVGG